MDAMFSGELGDGFGLFQEFLHDLRLKVGVYVFFILIVYPIWLDRVQFMGYSIQLQTDLSFYRVKHSQSFQSIAFLRGWIEEAPAIIIHKHHDLEKGE